MFKKDFVIATQNPLSQKDRKKLRKDLEKGFNDQSLTDLFMNIDQFHVSKLEKSKVNIYSSDTDPLFVDATSKGDFFPTVYALQMAPKLINVYIKLKPTVEKIALKGSNIFWPGVQEIEVIRDFKQDDVVGVKNSDGIIIAVGAVAVSKEQASDIESLEGVACYSLTYQFDFLYQKGSMQEKKICKGISTEANESVNQIDNQENQEQQENNLNEEIMDLDFLVGNKKSTAANKKDKNKVTNKKQNIFKDEDEKESKKIVQQKSDKEDLKLQKQNDERLMNAFLNGVVLILKDKEMPMENSKFWNEIVVQGMDPNQPYDLKNTSYKKMGKFFQHLEKQKLIKYKEVSKKVDVAQVESILRQNKLIEDWVPTINLKTKEKEHQKENNQQKLSIHKSIKNYVTLDEKQKQILHPIPTENVLLYQDWKLRVEDYLEKSGLFMEADKKREKVQLTAEIKELIQTNKAIAKGNQKKNIKKQKEESEEEDISQFSDDQEGEQSTNEIPLTKLLEKLEQNLKFYFTYEQIRPELPEKIKINNVKSKFKGIQIVQENSHNKQVTKIENLQYYSVDLNALLNIYKKLFDTAGSIQKENTELVIQGAFGEQIKEHLMKEFEFQDDEVHFTDKISKKHQKKNKQ